MRKTGKRVCQIITVILVIVIAVLAFSVRKSSIDRAKYNKAMEEKLRPLMDEKEELHKQISGAGKESQIIGSAVMILTVMGADSEAYSLVYPILKQYGCNAVLLLRSNLLPGDEGAMTYEQFQELLAQGWGYSIAAEESFDSAEQMGQWIGSFRENLTAHGIEDTDSVFFRETFYKPEYDAWLKDLGYRYVFQQENKEITTSEQMEDAYTCISAAKWNQSGASAYFYGILKKKGIGAFEIRLPREDAGFQEDLFRSMLDSIKESIEGNALRITTCAEGCKILKEQKEQIENAEKAYESMVEQANERLEAIEKEISTLYVPYEEALEER